ncbi:MAG: GAF domain-containing sensor histidine kinase [Dehalococcoidia bacterium]
MEQVAIRSSAEFRRARGILSDLRRLRWATIVGPVVFLVLFDLLREGTDRAFWYSTPGVLITLVGVTGAVSAFALVVFREIERMEARAAKRTAQMAALNRIAAVTAENLDLYATISHGLDEIVTATGADASLVCRLHADEAEHTAIGARGFSTDVVQRIQRAKLADDPVATEVLRTKRPVWWGDVFDDPDVLHHTSREGIRSGMSVPLVSSGTINGIVVVAYRSAYRFDDDDREFLRNVGQQLGLAIQNAQLYEQSQRQNRDLSALLRVQAAVSSSLVLDEVLTRSLEVVTQLTSADAGEFWLPAGDVLVLHRVDRSDAPPLLGETRWRAGELVDDPAHGTTRRITAGTPEFSPALAAAGYSACCITPLRFGGSLMGVMILAARDPRAMSEPQERALLDAIGEQIATAIENANLHREVEDVSTLRERERISREMHDGLGQVLGYVNTQVQAVRRLLDTGQQDAATDELRRLDTAARSLYADVRDNILALRSSPVDRGLACTLAEYVDAYREAFGIDVQLDVSPEVAMVSLPAGSEIQLIRIVQQALSNTRQHSGATAARVTLTVDGDSMQVEVSDNGMGFDPASLPSVARPRFGLQTMRERAQAVGGTFIVASAAGRGARVIVRLPVRR